MQKFTIKIENSEKRLDLFLVKVFNEEYSRSYIQKIIENGYVLVNNRKPKISHKLKENDEIIFNSPPPKTHKLIAQDIPLAIVYEDDDIIVVNKVSGMVVHPAYGNDSDTLVNALLFHCKNKLSDIGLPQRPGIVHRLDKEVSGLLVAAKTDQAYWGLVEQFKQRSVYREYIAFVKGRFADKKGRIELPIGRSIKDRKKMSVRLAQKSAKPAKTYYEVLKNYNDFAKLSIKLSTGRTHQIRVHMSYIKHPILGDSKYGNTKPVSGRKKAARLMLHAVNLGFKHPTKEQDLFFESKLPDEFNLLEK